MQAHRKHAYDDDGKEPSSCREKRRCCRTLPSKDTPGNRSVTIARSTLVPDELGLFAGKDIEDEAVVCSFDPISRTYLQHVRFVESTGLQEFADAGLIDMGRVLWDPAFKDADMVPSWYRLNHSYFPNLKMRLKKGLVEWVAIGDIKAGAELTFGYGEPDPAWDYK